jgi:hypothetical protein
MKSKQTVSVAPPKTGISGTGRGKVESESARGGSLPQKLPEELQVQQFKTGCY